jgi:hypothetical protein
MFIGHLPAGYLISHALSPKSGLDARWRGRFLWAGAAGALGPDLDVLYFYLVDHRQHHHHGYLTHMPVLWLGMLIAAGFWLATGREKPWAAMAAVFSFNGLVHMALDSIVGDIRWLEPFSAKSFALFKVPTLYQPWWLNFFLHWSFGFEIAVTALGVYVFIRRKHALMSQAAPSPARKCPCRSGI